jgi:hypothetical protein
MLVVFGTVPDQSWDEIRLEDGPGVGKRCESNREVHFSNLVTFSRLFVHTHRRLLALAFATFVLASLLPSPIFPSSAITPTKLIAKHRVSHTTTTTRREEQPCPRRKGAALGASRHHHQAPTLCFPSPTRTHHPTAGSDLAPTLTPPRFLPPPLSSFRR